jgi:hypothetical protein
MTLPAPTLSTSTVDYIPAGVRRFTFVPTIASHAPGAAAPTSAELTAGKDYTPDVTAVAGFTQTATDVDNSSFASDYTTTVPGMRSSAASTWTMKASSSGDDARTELVPGTNGFVVIYNEGIVTGGKCDVWPVRIKSCNADQVAMGALATITVEFSIPFEPTTGVAIPTS